MGEIQPIPSDDGADFYRIKWYTLEPRTSRTGVLVQAGTQRECVGYVNPGNRFTPKTADDGKTCLRFRLVTPDILSNNAYLKQIDADGNAIKPRWMTAEWAEAIEPDVVPFDPGEEVWPARSVLQQAVLNVANTLTAGSDDEPEDNEYNPTEDPGNGAAWDDFFPPPPTRARVGARELSALGPVQRGPRRPRRSARIAANRSAA